MTTIRAGLYGLCVADALGVPAESRTREDLKRNPITGMVGGLHQQPAGYWSDDSSMTLCLADSIGKVLPLPCAAATNSTRAATVP